MNKRPPALLSQVLAVNTLLLVATVFTASVAARLDLTSSDGLHQFLIVSGAIGVTVLANAMVLRRRFRPLEDLVETMGRVDLSTPGVRAQARRDEPAEVQRLRVAFNGMLGRIETERAGAASAVLRAQEEERARIARDLHDEVNQALTAILLRLGASAADAPPQLAAELAETRALAQQAMDELLHLARELRPAALDDHGLVPALRSQVTEFGRRPGMTAHLKVADDLPELSADEQLVIYRVAQESLSNIARHADARTVLVTLDRALDEDGHVRLRVCDDGNGLHCPSPTPGTGLGVAGMRERALLAGGRLEVTSPAETGQGTTVELAL
ncbi:MAG: sensor histidine kinase [Solirubrobacteraceae bacterium]|nr:sensor histidine kinase [Solirubrobacteraceae bacterium]